MIINAELTARWGSRGALASLYGRLLAMARTIALWRQRTRQRRHLLALEDRLYRDIGVTAGDVYRETRKPFWRA